MMLIDFLILALLQFCVEGHSALEPSVRHVSPKVGIIDGNEAVPHEAPYMAYVQIVMSGSMKSCGGILIDRQFVLTAGHCLRGSKTRVYRVDLGVHDLWDIDNQQREASSFAVHDKFGQDVASHDIALIKLKQPANVTPGRVEIARLPPAASYPERRDAFAGKDVTLFGWGRTQQEPAVLPHVLQKLDAKVVAYEQCRDLSGATEDDLCVGRRDGKPGTTCFGDSGGPLVQDGVVIGVDSRLSSWSCRDSPVALYARVDYHLDWIKQKMAELK